MMLREPVPEYGEISRRLGIPHGSIGPTRQRGLAQLRRSTALVELCSE
jgi:DNA-directed RNA polymerase specialized sigma24 family protein